MSDRNDNDYTFGGQPIGRELMLELARESVAIQRRDRERSLQENDRPEECEAPDGPVHGCATREEGKAEIYAAARLRHPDFDLLEPAMHLIAEAFQPQNGRINYREYLEALYCIAKHADFVAPVREQIFLKEVVPVSDFRM